MDNFKQYFTEANIYYTAPNNPEYLLFDFYMMEWLISNANPDAVGNPYHMGQEQQLFRSRMGIDTSTYQSLLDAKSELIETTRNKMLIAVMYAIISELRHTVNETDSPDTNIFTNKYRIKDRFQEEIEKKIWQSVNFKQLPVKDRIDTILYLTKRFAKKYNIYGSLEASKLVYSLYGATVLSARLDLGPGTGAEPGMADIRYSDSPRNQDQVKINNATDRTKAWAIFMGMNIPKKQWPEVVSTVRDIYKNLIWTPAYGGDAWAMICNAWLSLYYAKTDRDKMTYIDHMYDIQHNNDTVLDKVVEWYGDRDSLKWLKHGLDFKRDIHDPTDLLHYVSPQMRKIAQRILAQSGRRSTNIKEAETPTYNFFKKIYEFQKLRKNPTGESYDNTRKFIYISSETGRDDFMNNTAVPYMAENSFTLFLYSDPPGFISNNRSTLTIKCNAMNDGDNIRLSLKDNPLKFELPTGLALDLKILVSDKKAYDKWYNYSNGKTSNYISDPEIIRLQDRIFKVGEKHINEALSKVNDFDSLMNMLPQYTGKNLENFIINIFTNAFV